MGSNLPAWWSSAFPDLVAKRESMPGRKASTHLGSTSVFHSAYHCVVGVERLQTVYVKYRRFQEAQVGGGPGWDLNTSRKNFEQVARLEQQFFMQDDHPLFNPLAPDNITMRITEAPAEFAVPVKQDRQAQMFGLTFFNASSFSPCTTTCTNESISLFIIRCCSFSFMLW